MLCEYNALPAWFCLYKVKLEPFVGTRNFFVFTDGSSISNVQGFFSPEMGLRNASLFVKPGIRAEWSIHAIFEAIASFGDRCSVSSTGLLRTGSSRYYLLSVADSHAKSSPSKSSPRRETQHSSTIRAVMTGTCRLVVHEKCFEVHDVLRNIHPTHSRLVMMRTNRALCGL